MTNHSRRQARMKAGLGYEAAAGMLDLTGQRPQHSDLLLRIMDIQIVNACVERGCGNLLHVLSRAGSHDQEINALEGTPEAFAVRGIGAGSRRSTSLEKRVQLHCGSLGPLAGSSGQHYVGIGFLQQQSGQAQARVPITSEDEYRLVFHS
jgi:hypothetical protein